MTGVPALKWYRPWREIAAELASCKDLAKALELVDELNCALKQQGVSAFEEEKVAVSMTEEQLSLVRLF